MICLSCCILRTRNRRGGSTRLTRLKQREKAPDTTEALEEEVIDL